MKFKKINLEEDYLIEATVPTHRDILLNLIEELTTSKELKQILNSSSERTKIEFHHIDGIYEEVGFIIKRKKAKYNNPGNIALMYSDAHRELTNLNKEAKTPQERLQNLELLMQKEDYANKIFPLNMCLPHLIAKSLEKATLETL